MPSMLKTDPSFQAARECYNQFTANEAMMERARAREKWLKDYNSNLYQARLDGLAEGEKRGRAEGHAEGHADGVHQKAVATARAMLKKGYAAADIVEITGLDEQEIKDLQ